MSTPTPMPAELEAKVQELSEKAKAAFSADLIQECCKNLDEIMSLLEANGIHDMPAEVEALALACVAVDAQTLAQAKENPVA